MYRLLRPLLFALPPETSHRVALAALRTFGALPGGKLRHAGGTRLLGLEFANRIGAAAGLDKDGVAVAGLARLGFGFVEVGTVTPRPQLGNPKPRLFRLTEDEALVNRLGFNSCGADAVAANLRRLRAGAGVPIGVNIGKNRDTPLAEAAADYVVGLTALYDFADYFTVNVSSPNTPGLRDLQAAPATAALIGELCGVRNELAVRREGGSRAKPLLVKLAPDLAPQDLEATAVAALEAGAAGFVAGNTTLARPATLRSGSAGQAGGLSGRPLLPLAIDAVRRLRAGIGDGPVLIGVGGIASATDARAMLDAGADLVQVYTALVYEGPRLVYRLVQGT